MPQIHPIAHRHRRAHAIISSQGTGYNQRAPLIANRMALPPLPLENCSASLGNHTTLCSMRARGSVTLLRRRATFGVSSTVLAFKSLRPVLCATFCYAGDTETHGPAETINPASGVHKQTDLELKSAQVIHMQSFIYHGTFLSL